MGASGSGKSTLLNILGILDDYDSGEYWLGDTLIRTLSESKAANYRNRFIGFVFQSFNLLPFKTALENVALPLYYQGVSRRKRNQIAEQYLERVGLRDWADHLPSEMSGGQKQRVAIARALIGKPRLILADEPTGALDSETSRQIMDLMAEINETGITVLVVTHDPEVAARTQRTIRLKDGKVVGARRALHAAQPAAWPRRRARCSSIAQAARAPGSRADRDRRASSSSSRSRCCACCSSAHPVARPVLVRSLDRGARHDRPQQAAHGADDDQRRVGHLRARLPARARPRARQRHAAAVRARRDERRLDHARTRRRCRTAATTSAATSSSTTPTTSRAKTRQGHRSHLRPALHRRRRVRRLGADDQARRQGEHVRDQRRPPGRVLPRRTHEIVEGRFLTEGDIAQKRKSAVVGKPVVDFLFGADEDPIGQWIEIGGVPFQVVGVFTRPGRRRAGAPDLRAGLDRAAGVQRRRRSSACSSSPSAMPAPAEAQAIIDQIIGPARRAPQLRSERHAGRPRPQQRRAVPAVLEAVLDDLDVRRRDRPRHARGRRRRRVEHHDDRGQGAHEGDRRAQGARRDAVARSCS